MAELFYKFHSFTLETIAFLATWFVLDVSSLPTIGKPWPPCWKGLPCSPPNTLPCRATSASAADFLLRWQAYVEALACLDSLGADARAT